jgi:hypothetical protein
MKPTIKIALLRSPGHGARQWLQHLTQPNKHDEWRASFETQTNHYDLTIGMPAISHPHAALVIVNSKEGVTELLKRNLWHAQRRQVKHWFALIHSDAPTPDLFDLATLELRECLQSVGLEGDSLRVFCAPPDRVGLSEVISSLYAALDAEVIYQEQEVFAQLEEQYPLTRLIRKLFFYDPDVTGFWQEETWSAFCRGEAPAVPAERLWRFHSILYQACCGYFDDVPDLVALAGGLHTRLAFELLGQVGTWELWPLVESFLKQRVSYDSGDQLFYAIRHWSYLSCVPKLMSIEQISRATGMRSLIDDKLWQLLGAKPWEGLTQYYQSAQASYLPQQLLFFGKPFSIVEAVRHLLPQRRAVGFERNLTNLFMAQTGQLYDDRQLNIFLQNRATSFQPGRRYFNGSELPDYSTRNK